MNRVLHNTQKFNIGLGFQVTGGAVKSKAYYTLVTGKPIAPTHVISLVFTGDQ